VCFPEKWFIVGEDAKLLSRHTAATWSPGRQIASVASPHLSFLFALTQKEMDLRPDWRLRLHSYWILRSEFIGSLRSHVFRWSKAGLMAIRMNLDAALQCCVVCNEASRLELVLPSCSTELKPRLSNEATEVNRCSLRSPHYWPQHRSWSAGQRSTATAARQSGISRQRRQNICQNCWLDSLPRYS